MSATRADALTIMTRRSRKHVHTVAHSEWGRAACADARPLFDAVEFQQGATYRDRLDAATVCRGCPLVGTCGFRITATGQKRGGGR